MAWMAAFVGLDCFPAQTAVVDSLFFGEKRNCCEIYKARLVLDGLTLAFLQAIVMKQRLVRVAAFPRLLVGSVKEDVVSVGSVWPSFGYEYYHSSNRGFPNVL